MKGYVTVSAAFRVIRSTSWDASSFGVIDVEVRQIPEDDFFPARVVVTLRERGGKPPIVFDADDYAFDGNFLRFRINAATERWVFQALQ